MWRVAAGAAADYNTTAGGELTGRADHLEGSTVDPSIPGPTNPRLAALIEQAARYQERTVACLRSGRRPDGTLSRQAIQRAILELSAAIDCLRQASELAEGEMRNPLEATLQRREQERESLEAMLKRGR
jgi:hypothetical protein